MSVATVRPSALCAGLLLALGVATSALGAAMETTPATLSTPASANTNATDDLPVWAHKLVLSSHRSGSVSIWLGICTDLCSAGLGGTACGPTCVAATPDTTMMGMRVSGVKSKPRQEVCPILCRNNLGYPLCGCRIKYIRAGTPDWDGICQEFCNTQGMTLTGCPVCSLPDEMNAELRHIDAIPDGKLKPITISKGNRNLKGSNPNSLHLSDKTIHFNDADIGGGPNNWEEWCNLVCKTGDGGAACNCDLAPFS